MQNNESIERSSKATPLLFWLDRLLILITLVGGGATLAFMTAYSVFNVLVMRKALNSPIQGAEDYLMLSLVVIVALSIPFGARAGAHIEIEVLEPSMSERFAKVSMILVKLLSIVLLSFMTWRLWEAGTSAVRFGETTQQLLISFEPFYYLLAFSIGLYALILILDIWQILTRSRVTNIDIGAEL
jgi:TRAP-type C4-dicarboxylate transport system permease small subunit